ncbi:hypothetical protein GCM10008171_20000 [Methylopila jiangsuensis]|uniref:Metallo-beta-lactamase domain-containing protein n=1 Tax=Methylopila jiangsuensis TaxID=586230 RepID=A0A9W6JHZ1_9HYPH|nr:quinoprotein relay system zinc metallohydrolase 1 [Methylopila jiangsuensis]MDR6286905.1 quinoprotein relay system zinc metallohydrolase 1 [Methylopila jiangsuensis]GLK76746.1 hypothetical protein GCM10008171_20000 [Methylopila jiangsuensis]
MIGPLSRRAALALGAGALAAPLAVTTARARRAYDIRPEPIGDGVWLARGLDEPITAQNGGAIANVVIFDTREGAVLVDAGPSRAYGEALRAAARELTGKPVARVYLTHIHADHVFGAGAFTPDTVWTTAALRDDLAARGDALADAMYRVAGDWMRGTETPAPARAVGAETEDVGERRFRFLPLAGHTGSDLCLFEERSGLLVAGDLAFLDRAPTTPDADLGLWRSALDTLAPISARRLCPGHGPAEAGSRGLKQTRDWLDMIEERIDDGFERGLDVIELMAEPLPAWTDRLAVARYEFARSVMHRLPRLERERLPARSA